MCCPCASECSYSHAHTGNTNWTQWVKDKECISLEVEVVGDMEGVKKEGRGGVEQNTLTICMQVLW